MRRLKFIAALCLVFLAPASHAAEHGSQPLADQIIQQARRDCASLEGGSFSMQPDAISEHTLGDVMAVFVDASHFSCSSAASMWQGTGGWNLWVIVEGQVYEFLARDWKIVEVNRDEVLLLSVHHSECGDQLGPCYRALVWRNGFRTITSPGYPG